MEVIVSALERGQSVSVVGLNKKYIKNELKSGGRARQTKTKKQKVVSGREWVGARTIKIKQNKTRQKKHNACTWGVTG